MNKKMIAAALLAGALVMPSAAVDAAPDESPTETFAQAADEWYWLASDNKYSKYFNPNSVKVLKSSKRENGREDRGVDEDDVLV